MASKACRCSRRQFLGATAVASRLSFLPGCESEKTFRSLLIETSQEIGLPPALGKAYLQRDDSEEGAEEICTTLRERLSLGSWGIFWLDSAKLVDRLGTVIREDFAGNHSICQVQGWFLSRTECRLAALAYLSSPRSDQEDTSKEEATVADEPFDQGILMDVINWHPRFAVMGRPFSAKNDQESTFLIVGSSEIANDVKPYLSTFELQAKRQGNQLWATLPAEVTEQVLGKAQVLPLVLVSTPRKIWQKMGDFQVYAGS